MAIDKAEGKNLTLKLLAQSKKSLEPENQRQLHPSTRPCQSKIQNPISTGSKQTVQSLIKRGAWLESGKSKDMSFWLKMTCLCFCFWAKMKKLKQDLAKSRVLTKKIVKFWPSPDFGEKWAKMCINEKYHLSSCAKTKAKIKKSQTTTP